MARKIITYRGLHAWRLKGGSSGGLFLEGFWVFFKVYIGFRV